MEIWGYDDCKNDAGRQEIQMVINLDLKAMYNDLVCLVYLLNPNDTTYF